MNTQASNIAAQFPLAGTTLTNKFTFRKDRKTGVQREALEVKIPVATAAEVSVVLSKDQEGNEELSNVRDLIMAAIHGVTVAATKALIDDNTQFAPEDIAKFANEVGLHYIANLPKAQRGGITNAALSEFADFFAESAVERLQISEAAASNLSTIFRDRKTFASYVADDKTREVLRLRLESFGETLTEEELVDHNVALTYLTSSIEELSKPKFDVNQL